MDKSRNVCRDFLRGRCTRTNCRFSHDDPSTAQVRNNSHPFHRKPRNTESFEPMDKPVDMRLVVDIGKDHMTSPLASRDVVMAPNLFSDFNKGELFELLLNDINTCGIPSEQLMKLWHGDTHYIADDHTHWKKNAPVFDMVLGRIRKYFGMDIQATRFNWYKDTSQWKPFHHDSAYVNPEKAKVQNFTVAISFGATRDAAFEHAKTKTVISLPQPDGCAYAFAKDTNGIWRHGILKEQVTREEGRISIIAWGWVDGIEDI